MALGLELGGGGVDFAGESSTKGCYSYDSGEFAGKAYFGTGGSQAEMEQAVEAPKYRITCQDPSPEVPRVVGTPSTWGGGACAESAAERASGEHRDSINTCFSCGAYDEACYYDESLAAPAGA